MARIEYVTLFVLVVCVLFLLYAIGGAIDATRVGQECVDLGYDRGANNLFYPWHDGTCIEYIHVERVPLNEARGGKGK